jgi:hypothetical protein
MLTACPAWSTVNYDKALVSWGAQDVPDGVVFSTFFPTQNIPDEKMM